MSGEGKQLAGGEWTVPAGVWGGGGRQYTGRDNLEQFRTTKVKLWASVNNSYIFSGLAHDSAY